MSIISLIKLAGHQHARSIVRTELKLLHAMFSTLLNRMSLTWNLDSLTWRTPSLCRTLHQPPRYYFFLAIKLHCGVWLSL